MQGENYQIDKEHLMNIPLPLIPLEEQQEVIDKVDSILSKLSRDPLSNISEDENRIDILVYKLYGLKFEDARIIDSSLSKDEYDK
jgi:restriction endonuclease S subunit